MYIYNYHNSNAIVPVSSQVVANALVTATRDELSGSHPLRRLLKPFTYRTVVVNRASRPLLCTELSLLHRSIALDGPGDKLVGIKEVPYA